MNKDSTWEMAVCEYCFERMHYTELDNHKDRVHAIVMDAENTLTRMTKRESRLLLIIMGWFFLMAGLVVIGGLLGIGDGRYYIGLIIAIFAIFPVILVVQHNAPREEKERRKQAKEILLDNKVRCDICENMVPFRDYRSHLKKVHPKQVPYEWFRIGTFVLFIVIFGGGYLALMFLAETEWWHFEQVAILGILWIATTCVFMLWIFYLSQIGELKHIKKMREEWQDDRFRLELPEGKGNRPE